MKATYQLLLIFLSKKRKEKKESFSWKKKFVVYVVIFIFKFTCLKIDVVKNYNFCVHADFCLPQIDQFSLFQCASSFSSFINVLRTASCIIKVGQAALNPDECELFSGQKWEMLVVQRCLKQRHFVLLLMSGNEIKDAGNKKGGNVGGRWKIFEIFLFETLIKSTFMVSLIFT